MATLAEVYAQVKPAVVALGVPTGRAPKRPFAIGGTGFCVHRRGIIVTCRHVFEQFQELAPDYDTMLEEMKRNPSVIIRGQVAAPEAFFFFARGPLWVAIPVKIGDMVFEDDTDLIVMRAAAEHFQEPATPYPVMPMGDSDTLVEGEEVAVCGFPFGARIQPDLAINHILSTGVISAIFPAENAPRVVPQNFREFQLDMTIHKGNSGGPAFRRSDGSAVGVVAQAEFIGNVPVGIGHASPINRAKPLIDALLEGADAFRRRAWGQ